MHAPMRDSGYLCFRQPLKQERFLRRCCFFLSVYLLIVVAALGLGGLIVVFVLKPQKPVFSFQTIRLDAYEFSVYSNSTLFVSSVASLVLNASNPNKIGLRYSPSRLQLYLEGLPMAVIRVPGFFQPAHSSNVSLTARVLIPCLNVSQVLGGSWLQEQQGQYIVPMKLSGDIRVNLHFLHITLPKIKVALDCDINFEHGELAFLNEAYINKAAAKNFPASVISHPIVLLYRNFGFCQLIIKHLFQMIPNPSSRNVLWLSTYKKKWETFLDKKVWFF